MATKDATYDWELLPLGTSVSKEGTGQFTAAVDSKVEDLEGGVGRLGLLAEDIEGSLGGDWKGCVGGGHCVLVDGS